MPISKRELCTALVRKLFPACREDFISLGTKGLIRRPPFARGGKVHEWEGIQIRKLMFLFYLCLMK